MILFLNNLYDILLDFNDSLDWKLVEEIDSKRTDSRRPDEIIFLHFNINSPPRVFKIMSNYILMVSNWANGTVIKVGLIA